MATCLPIDRSWILIWSILCTTVQLQAIEPQEKTSVPVSLPSAWHGSWQGDMLPVNSAGEGERFQMKLDIAPIPQSDRLTWKIAYRGTAGESIRDYELVVEDAAKGRYVIDEKNGIRISAVLLGDSLYSHFTVADTTLWTRYTLKDAPDASIEFEVVTADSQTTINSGDVGDSPAVVSLIPKSRQIGKLSRVPVSNDPVPNDPVPSDQ